MKSSKTVTTLKCKLAHVAKVRRTSIPVYKLTRHGFQFRYYVAGKAERLTRATLAKVIEAAEEKATGIENGRVQAGDLSAADMQGYYYAVEELGKMGGKAPPLHVALAKYVSAKSLLPDGMSLAEAVRSVWRRRPGGRSSKTDCATRRPRT